MKSPVAIEHRPQGQNDGQDDLTVLMVTGRVQRGGSPAYQPCEAVDRRIIDATKMIAIEWDRELLERGGARVLANNFKDKKWLQMALKVSDRRYGKGSAERIKVYMREIWKTEMCK